MQTISADQWRLPVGDEARVLLAVYRCPKCGKECGVSRMKHRLEPDGSVHPSAICPHECGFHEYIALAPKASEEG